MMRVFGRSELEQKFSIHFILSRAFFLGSFWLIYLVSKGFTLVNAAFLDIVFWSTLFVFEIPTGFIADYFGRKVSLFLSFFLQAVAIFIFAIASNFTVFVISYAIWGFALTMQSGAEEAWIYDEVITSLGSEAKYQTIYGNLISLGFVSTAIAGIIGGVLAKMNLVYTIYATSICFFIASVWILFIPHHKRSEDEDTKPSIRKSIATLGNIKYLSTMQIVSNMALTVVIFWFQTYLDDRDVSYVLIGIILSAGALLVSVGGKITIKVTSILGENAILILSIIASLTMMMMSISILPAILGYWIIHLFRGVWYPLLSKLMNEKLPSHLRATSLSILGAIGTAFILLAEISSAWLIEHFGYNLVYLLLGLIVLIIFILLELLRRLIRTDLDNPLEDQ